MKSFERLVEDKNRVIKDCDNFIKELKDISLQTSGISTLIKLLSEKKEKYLELKYDNYKESTLSIENLDEKIYRQIVLLEKQNSQEAKSTLEKFGYEYRDQQKIKFIFKKIYFAKKHYKGLIALLGLMPFIIYFVLNRNIGYIPMPESGDIFSILVSLALAGLSLLFILYLMPILQLAVVFYMRDIKGILPVFLLSILLSVALIVLILNDISWISKNLELSFVSFYIIDILLIYIGLLFKTKSQKLMIFKSEQFWLLAFHGFISILSPFVIFLLVYSRVSNDSIENIVIVSIFILLAIILLFFLLLEKDLYYFAFWFYAFTAINLIIVCLISGKVIQISGLGNIQYKYLIVEKSIKDTLSVEICNKDCNISKTYYNEAGNVIKIYNIKALSTLGKFYYLEADSNTTDKKVKFKLDASKITPGPTLER